MKIAYAFIPHFAVVVERKRRPELAQLPLVIGGLPYGRRAVFDASPECTEAGVRPGMTLRQAQYLCPEATFLPRDQAAYTSVQETLLAALEKLSPAVEADGLGAAYLDAFGLELLYGGDEAFARRVEQEIGRLFSTVGQDGCGPHPGPLPKGEGAGSHLSEMSDAQGGCCQDRPMALASGGCCQHRRQSNVHQASKGEGDIGLARVAVATNRLVAKIAARRSRPGKPIVVRAGEERRFLEPLPVDLLPLDAEARARLRHLGIDTIGAFLRLPGAAIAERLGGGAFALYRRLTKPERLVPALRTSERHCKLALDFPLEDASAGFQVASRLAEDLAAALEESYQACRRVEVWGGYEDGRTEAASVLLKESVSGAEGLRRALTGLLERLPGGAIEVEVTVSELGPEPGRQLRLLPRQEQERRRERLEQALAHIRQRFGERTRPAATALPDRRPARR